MRLIVGLFVLGWLTVTSSAARPDVLFIVVDDLNDWISLLDSKAPINTPNLKRLASRGTSFTRAYCISAACNPSRAATLTGLHPSVTGIYGNKSDWRGALPKRPTIMQRFREEGYLVKGAGKIFHHHLDGAFHDDASFDEFQPMRPQLYPPNKLNGAKDYGSRNTDWGAWPPDEKDSIDHGTAEYCIRALKAKRDRPLFLACGIFKPHSPFFAPAKYQPGNPVPLPPRREDDWSDLPSGALKLMKAKQWFWHGMMKVDQRSPGSHEDFIRSYAACVAFADAQIGRVLDALDSSPQKDNTIIILWSDHGFHLGEKNHIEKFALWEKANHIPFIIVAPGITKPGTRCDVPVDLTVLYPTLLRLGGMPTDPICTGRSVVPLLADPNTGWDHPAISTYGRGNHTVRTARWRYLRYADGSEELYDHDQDPHEWTNLADNPKHAAILAEHRRWLPRTEAKRIRDLKKKK